MSRIAGARSAPAPAGTCDARALVLWLVAAVVAGTGAGWVLPKTIGLAPQPQFSAQLGGNFTLQSSDGTTITDRSLKGAPFVMVFGYSRCGAACEARLIRLAAWRRTLGEQGKALRIVLVSVDPARDTPQRIGAFAQRIDPAILALTGTQQAIARTTRAYNAMHFAAPLCGGDYTIIHSGAAYLMDADGRARAIIAEDEAPTAALGKLRALVRT